jgi:hypothetical protein
MSSRKARLAVVANEIVAAACPAEKVSDLVSKLLDIVAT